VDENKDKMNGNMQKYDPGLVIRGSVLDQIEDN